MFHDRSVIKLRKYIAFIRRIHLYWTCSNSISLHLLIKFTGVAPCILVFCSVDFSSHVGCPPSGAKKCQNVVVNGVSYSCLLIELGPICNSMAASLWLESCKDHSLLKIYNGGLWKNNYRSGPLTFTSVQMTLIKNKILYHRKENVLSQVLLNLLRPMVLPIKIDIDKSWWSIFIASSSSKNMPVQLCV